MLKEWNFVAAAAAAAAADDDDDDSGQYIPKHLKRCYIL